MHVTCSTQTGASLVDEAEFLQTLKDTESTIASVLQGRAQDKGSLGWHTVSKAAVGPLLQEAKRVQSLAEEMIVIGIGGSNRGAIAAYEVLKRDLESPTSLYFAGDTLSPLRLEDMLQHIREKSVVLNVIAKDFNTLEPGITFRMAREAMIERYGDSYATRVIVTGSEGEGNLFLLAQQHGYTYLPFPSEIGGRFSVLSEVGLFPLAVAGVDIDTLLDGAMSMEQFLKQCPLAGNPAVRYALYRYLMGKKGIPMESLVVFEPDLLPFTRWWVQLFGETEGKCEQALFPVAFAYSEDLHAVGQYVQEGPKIIMETFLDLHYPRTERTISSSDSVEDGFSYLDGKLFSVLNQTVYQAAMQAHIEAGVPCLELSWDACLGAHTLGSLFYFFMMSAYISSSLLGVNPFNQNGVEQYKKRMYASLGKRGYTK